MFTNNGQVLQNEIPKYYLSDEDPKYEIPGSVMDGIILDVNEPQYKVSKTRWLMLGFFVMYSASNALQWTQYTIISDIVVNYYGVTSKVVSWTSMVYMIAYVPLIFPASWLLDKTCWASANLIPEVVGSIPACAPTVKESSVRKPTCL
ncbi:unnamed protein product [Pieris macdunnoughi]|uniref:Uncharacterized protein n=1 Tax=Pieris macdunnoughi TaxID=345717 RepID=A0A821XWN4_9NEOP|nr:unnamed protein product [Pieris macdunnoughi]